MNILDILKACISHRIYRGNPEYDENIQECENLGISKIAFYIGCEDNRSERYRVHNIVEALRKKNIVVDIYRANSIHHLLKDVHYDLLVVFREDRYRFLQLGKIGRHLKKQNIPIIYDTDDYTIENKDAIVTKNICKILQFTDAITVTTESLAERFIKDTGKPVYVIRNTINYKQLIFARKTVRLPEDGKVRIVYQSGTLTHNRDFALVEATLFSILKKYTHVELHIFGPLELTDRMRFVTKQIIYHPYMDYLCLQGYVSEMDINIAPLEMMPFNHCKSELKIFEAALLGIPTVCSPVDSYKAIIKDGVNGCLASNEEEWEKALIKLIEEKEFRENIGKKAYLDFVNKYYIDNNIEEILSIYERIAKAI